MSLLYLLPSVITNIFFVADFYFFVFVCIRNYPEQAKTILNFGWRSVFEYDMTLARNCFERLDLKGMV